MSVIPMHILYICHALVYTLYHYNQQVIIYYTQPKETITIPLVYIVVQLCSLHEFNVTILLPNSLTDVRSSLPMGPREVAVG